MNKKFGCLVLVGCLGLTVSGCKAEVADFDKQLDKMNGLIEEDKIFDKDYQVKGYLEFTDRGEATKGNFHFERDSNNYWVKLDADSTETIETWVGEKDGKYYAFYKEDERKEYKQIDEKDVNDIMNDTLDVGSFDANLEEMYKEMYEMLTSFAKTCKDNSEGVTCSIEKSLFGTVTLTLKGEENGVQQEIRCSIRGGKIREFFIRAESGNYFSECYMEYSYGNQIVRLPDTEEFTQIDK